MDRFAQATLLERSAEPRGFVARQLDAQMIEEADLVLCAAREHRAEVVTLHPRATRYAFTIREFARLTAHATPDDIRRGTVQGTGAALVDYARSQRGRHPLPADPTDDEIPDPYGQSRDAFRTCADQLADSLRGPIELLTEALRSPLRS